MVEQKAQMVEQKARMVEQKSSVVQCSLYWFIFQRVCCSFPKFCITGPTKFNRGGALFGLYFNRGTASRHCPEGMPRGTWVSFGVVVGSVALLDAVRAPTTLSPAAVAALTLPPAT